MLTPPRVVSPRHLPDIFEWYGRPGLLDDAFSPAMEGAAVLDRTRSHIVRLFEGEVAFIGLSGGLIGALAGPWMSVLITTYIFPARLAVARGVASTLCSILAGLYPARRAAALNGVEALA